MGENDKEDLIEMYTEKTPGFVRLDGGMGLAARRFQIVEQGPISY